ncbi:MAG: hypothetical protein KBD37_00285 [Burkholderiales bacterium]|nr:hypothetical protein [Burkholderiales bacterium]
MKLVKLYSVVIGVLWVNFVHAQAVVVTSITDPSYINMSVQAMKTDAQLLAQLSSSVQNIQYNYQMANANNNLTSNFAAFAGIFSTISNFMKSYVCEGCSPGSWNSQQYDEFEGDFCQNIAHILGTGADVFSNVGQLAQDINQIMNLKFSTMNPAQMATTQAQLLGSLGTGVQQTNTILNASLQMQTQALADNQMKRQSNNMQMKNSLQNMSQQIKP